MRPFQWIWKNKLKPLLILLLYTALISFGGVSYSQTLGTLPFPFTIDGEPNGDIMVMVDDDNGFLISLPQLQDYLTPILTDELLDKVSQLPAWVSLSDLAGIGIETAVDESTLSIRVNISTKQKAIHTISLTTGISPSTSNLLEPADFSFYINFFADSELNLSTKVDDVYLSSPISLRITPNFQFQGWVLSSSIKLQTEIDSYFTLESISLLKDFSNSGIRFTAGNINYENLRFQTNSTSIGVMVTNRFQQSGIASSSRNSFSSNLYLDKKSRVDVRINDIMSNSYNLPSGRFILQDFSFIHGVNEVSIEISPESGETSSETFLIGYDFNTLAQAETRYSYGIGYDNWKIDWTTLPTFFGMQKFGITDNITAGYGFQVSDSQQFAGVDAIWATTIGTLNASGAITNLQGTGVGGALYAGYTYSRKNYPGLSLSGTYYSDLFIPYGTTSLTSLKPLFSLTATAGYTFIDTFGMSGSITMDTDRNTRELAFSGNLHVSARISKTLSLSATGSVKEKNGDLNWGGSLRVSYHPDNNSTIIASSNLEDGNTNITYQTTPEEWNGAGKIIASLSGVSPDDPLPSHFSASGNYKTQTMDFSLSQHVTFGNTTTDPVVLSTSLKASTALTYADGLLGMSRPISDSFVIIGSKYDTEGLIFGTRSANQVINSSENIFGTVVIQNISSNNNNKIFVDILDSPIGFDPGQDTATFRPSYRQGAVFKIGTEAESYAQGNLVFADSVPASLLFGTVTELENESAEPQYIFTDHQGYFFIYGLKPGKYVISLDVAGWENYILDVVPGMPGLIELGEFALQHTSDELKTRFETIVDTFSGPTVVISEETFPVDKTITESLIDTYTKNVLGRLLLEDQSAVQFCNGGVVKVNDDSFDSLFFTTDYNGQFFLGSLPPGEYELTFFYLDALAYSLWVPDTEDNIQLSRNYIIYDTLVAAAIPETETIATRTLVSDVSSYAEAVPEAEIEEEPELPEELSVAVSASSSGGTVSGRITYSDGTPLPFLNGSIVREIIDYTTEDPVFFSTDINGYFSIPDIEPGKYNLQLFLYEILEYDFLIPMKTSIPETFDYILDDIIIT